MPSKVQFYAQMADHAATQITGSYQSWISFLETAGRLYKYPYAEQLMIHAQRPDATACAEFDFWNQQWGRYVRRGSKGIALIEMQQYLEDDEADLRELTDNAVNKLEKISDERFELLDLIPDFDE